MKNYCKLFSKNLYVMIGVNNKINNINFTGLFFIYADLIKNVPSQYFENVISNLQDQIDYITLHYSFNRNYSRYK